MGVMSKPYRRSGYVNLSAVQFRRHCKFVNGRLCLSYVGSEPDRLVAKVSSSAAGLRTRKERGGRGSVGGRGGRRKEEVSGRLHPVHPLHPREVVSGFLRPYLGFRRLVYTRVGRRLSKTNWTCHEFFGTYEVLVF